MLDQLSGSGPKNEIKNFQNCFMGKTLKINISAPEGPNFGQKKCSDPLSTAEFIYLSNGIEIYWV